MPDLTPAAARPPDQESQRPLRIALVSDWFAEQMGYSENCLPKALAALGHEVHVITSDAQPYFNTAGYAATYEPFIGPGLVQTGTKVFDGYTLHRMPHGWRRGRFRIPGLRDVLTRIQPDIVQAFEVANLTTFEAAWAQASIGYRLFTESHVHASVVGARASAGSLRHRLVEWAYDTFALRLIDARTERCYPISADAADVATRLYRVSPRKLEVSPLGVDTDLFRPAASPALRETRSVVRRQLGFRDDEIVCIYTGRFAGDKGPEILAAAVEILARQGEPYRGLFVGSGSDAEANAIAARVGCQLHPFVASRDLPPLYWAADIGVWPKQESTSQLDAAACGLPIILSDRVTVRERVEGNGLTYGEGDAADLAEKLRALREASLRDRMGTVGSVRMHDLFSWRRTAEYRATAYRAALGR
jgi:glycosyltransferase involved in cell wall biosynthesis